MIIIMILILISEPTTRSGYHLVVRCIVRLKTKMGKISLSKVEYNARHLRSLHIGDMYVESYIGEFFQTPIVILEEFVSGGYLGIFEWRATGQANFPILRVFKITII